MEDGATVQSKEERKAMRAAKKARRQERLDQKQQRFSEKISESIDESDIIVPLSKKTLTKVRVNRLSEEMALAIKGMQSKRLPTKKPRDYAYTSCNKIQLGKRKWDELGVQPRLRDYGGIGLARPSLFLSFADPSFLPKLESEFAEHIPGFFGKQRTKAMKKQLNADMLWKRMLIEKQQYSSTISGKKKRRSSSDQSTDERVKAMKKGGVVCSA